jgi:sugar lactone lactonase YvrE
MAMARITRFVFAALVALFAADAASQTLYASSLRTYSDPGYHGVEGNLYLVDTETAATTLVTSLNVGGKTPVGIDGLAIHPRTGVFYGITAPTSSVIPRSLVIIDPTTGTVTLVGDLGETGSDIGFDPDGTLYVWMPIARRLGVVDLDTGHVTPRGTPIEHGATKGGFAFIGNGHAYLAVTGGSGTLDTIDLATGAVTTGPALVGAPFPDLMTGLAFSRGTVYAVNTNFGRSTEANLVTIDPHTGKVTNVGALPNDTDALTFGPSQVSKDVSTSILEWRIPILVALGVFALVVIIVAMRSSGKPNA